MPPSPSPLTSCRKRRRARHLARRRLNFLSASKATWAEIDVIDPNGVNLIHFRIDLSQLADAMVVMRRLGDEVESAASTDYEHRASAFHIEIN